MVMEDDSIIMFGAEGECSDMHVTVEWHLVALILSLLAVIITTVAISASPASYLPFSILTLSSPLFSCVIAFLYFPPQCRNRTLVGEGRWTWNSECCRVLGLASGPAGHGGELLGENHDRTQSSQVSFPALATANKFTEGELCMIVSSSVCLSDFCLSV